MKKRWWTLFAMWSVIFVVALSFGVSGAKVNSNKYEDMVNASVLMYGDRGHVSGVFIDDNVILTAAHCLRNRNSLNIELNDGTILKSSDFYVDGQEDIGFVFVKADELHIAKVSKLPGKLGDDIYLVGTPYHKDYKFTLIKGILSHLSRDDSDFGWIDLLQIDADGGMGNSGGPLYNSKGDLIGMYVGQCLDGGRSISLCESAKSILEAYERCLNARQTL